MARQLLLKPNAPLGGVNVSGLRAWRVPLAGWGVGAGLLVSLLLSNAPIFKNDVLIKVPIVGSYWEDKTAPEDRWH